MRILITGASGSGTTTLGKSLSEKLGWEALDTDDFYWIPTTPPYQQKRDHAERLVLLLDALQANANSIVTGSVMKWDRALENSFDLIVFLYLDAEIRVERLRKRELAELGFIDEEFLQWAADYDHAPTEGRSLAKHEKWLSERNGPILRLEGDLTVEERAQQVIAELGF